MNHEKRFGLSYRIGEQATQAILTVDPRLSASKKRVTSSSPLTVSSRRGF